MLTFFCREFVEKVILIWLIAIPLMTEIYGQNLINVRGFGGNLADTWEWNSIEGAMCRDGSPAGYFSQQLSGAKELLIYLEGGGACFNSQTCVNTPRKIGEDKYPSNVGLLAADDSRNPVSGWNKVYVPYCTGDVMTGDREDVRVSPANASENFVGFRNMNRFLDHLVYQFSYVERILLAGESAGGFGALYNFDQVQSAFGSTPVQLLDDSGIMFFDEHLDPCLQNHWRNLWNMDGTSLVECDFCRTRNGGGLIKYLDFLLEKYPRHQFAFVSSTKDKIIRFFYGFALNQCQPIIPLLSERHFKSGLMEFRQRFSKDQVLTFFTEGNEHTFLTKERFFMTSEENIPLFEWVGQLLQGEARSVGL